MNPRPRILLVDDNTGEEDVIRAAADGLGADLAICPTPEQGLERAGSEPADAILVNVLMEGQSGYEICRRLKARAETAEIPILFVTPRGREESLLPGFEALAFDFVPKPFQARELKVRIQNALRQKALLDEVRALSRFSECCVSLWRAFDEADSLEAVQQRIARELSLIAAFLEADGACFGTLAQPARASAGILGGPIAAEIPASHQGFTGVLRLFRSHACNSAEMVLLSDLAAALARGFSRWESPVSS